MAQIKMLTKDEEKFVLNTLLECETIGCGSSRYVFMDNGETIQNYFGFDRPVVVKVACGGGGMTQNDAECELYEQNGDDLPLAKIMARGKFIEIMEAIEELDYVDTLRDVMDYCCDQYDVFQAINDFDVDDNWTEDDLIITEAEAEEVYDVVNYLVGYTGFTTDNAQLGRTIDGDLVCYDYGYVVGGSPSGREQVSSHTYSIQVEKYIHLLLEKYDILDYTILLAYDDNRYRVLGANPDYDYEEDYE